MSNDCRHCGLSAEACDDKVRKAVDALAVSVRTDPERRARVARRNECCPNCAH
jgi:hypothetical protein